METVVARLIDSLLDQTYCDWEHLIIDSLSSDGTADVIEKYKHIRFKSEADSGIYEAMNKGIKLAKGEWIYFIGADDRLHDPKVLENVAKNFDDCHQVVYGDVISPRFNGRYDGPFDFVKIKKRNLCHQSVFFHQSVFNIVGDFNTQYSALSDWEHNLRWIFDGEIRSKYIDLIIADYADGGFSSTVEDPLYMDAHVFKYVSYGRSKVRLRYRLKVLFYELVRSIQKLRLKRAMLCAGKLLSEPFK